MAKKSKFGTEKLKPVIVRQSKPEEGRKELKIDKNKVEKLGKEQEQNPFEDKNKFSQDRLIDIPTPTLVPAPAPQTNLENIAEEAPAPASNLPVQKRGIYNNVVNAPQYTNVSEGGTRIQQQSSSRTSFTNPGTSWVNTTKPAVESIQNYSAKRPEASQAERQRMPFERNIEHGEIDKDRIRKYLQEEQS